MMQRAINPYRLWSSTRSATRRWCTSGPICSSQVIASRYERGSLIVTSSLVRAVG